MVEFYIGADVGGTNTNFALIKLENNKSKIIKKKNYESKNNFYVILNRFLEEESKGKKIEKCVLACAGKIEKNKVQITNNSNLIKKKEIIKKTSIKKVILMNDFTAISYGIEKLKKKQFEIIKPGKKIKEKPILVIGAGTGLGKSTLHYYSEIGYRPNESEAGQSDVSIYNSQEYELIEFIKEKYNRNYIVWEDILSGRGLVNIYEFLASHYKKDKIYPKTLTSKEISKNRRKNTIAKETFEIFYRILARACKNFAINDLCEGGIYIAGGIAMKNSRLNKKNFIQEFLKNDILKEMLKNIPIYLINDYNISLIGLANYIEKNKF